MTRTFCIAFALFATGASPALAATERLFSYDPADAETRSALGPVTLQFRQGLTHVLVENLRSTEQEATVVLSKAPESALGGGGLGRVIGRAGGSRDLYAIAPAKEGAALVSSLCSGSTHGWLAVGRPRYGQDLTVFVIGDQGGGGAPHLCRTLSFSFHGEWRTPQSGKFDTQLMDHASGPRSGQP